MWLSPKSCIFDHANYKKTALTPTVTESETILTARKSSNNKLALFTTHGIRLYEYKPSAAPIFKQAQLVSYVPTKKKLVVDHQMILSKPLLESPKTEKSAECEEQKLIEVKA
jgi:hypothetical protein